MTRQETIDRAVDWALAMARDDRHGYDQEKRWGPDYDCSSFVITAWQQAGVPVRTSGASYTGDMRAAFLRCGFRDVTGQVNLASGKGLQKGDVLLNQKSHAELYVGGGRCVKAGSNEHGGASGGRSGDQTGREICVSSYYNFPWDCVLRYMGGEKEAPSEADRTLKLPLLRRGSRGQSVRAMQGILIACGCGCGPDGADGDFGPATEAALRRFQAENGLETDGVCGERSWEKLLGVSA
ncbi:MAG: peptidoglycan-binding protein [Clostridia bacterium]